VVALILVCVIQQQYRNINVSALFFRNSEEAVTGKGTGRVGTAHLLLLEFSENDVHERQCPKRPEIYLLIRPGRPIDQGGEVMDHNNVVVRPEQLKEALKVQPLKGAATNRAVVEVEAVDVDDGARRH